MQLCIMIALRPAMLVIKLCMLQVGCAERVGGCMRQCVAHHASHVGVNRACFSTAPPHLLMLLT